MGDIAKSRYEIIQELTTKRQNIVDEISVSRNKVLEVLKIISAESGKKEA